MKNRVAAIVVVLVLALGAVLGCQAPPAAPATAASGAPAQATQAPAASAATQLPQSQPTAVPAAAAETLKLGISMGITGPAARGSIISERFMRMAIDDINAGGGIKAAGKTYRLDAVTVDDKFTADGGRDAANRLVLSEKVKVILGPGSSQATAGAQAITEPNKVLIFATGAADASLSPKFPFTISGGSGHQRMRVPALYDSIVKTRPQAKRLALLQQDDANGRGYVPIAQDAGQQRGFTVVSAEYFPLDTKDFNPLIARVLQQKPEIVDMGPAGASPALFAGIAKALYDQNYRGALVASWGYSSALQSGAAAEGFTYPVLADYKASVVPEKPKALIQRFIQKYGESETEPASVTIYDLPQIMAQAMAKAGTVDDTEKLVKTMREGEWDSIFGKARFVGAKTFGLPFILEAPIFLSKVEGGKVVTFDLIKGTLP